MKFLQEICLSLRMKIFDEKIISKEIISRADNKV